MRNDGETIEASESAGIERTEAGPAARANETERASGQVRRARGATPKRKSALATAAATTSPDRTSRAPKTKARSARKGAARSQEEGGKTGRGAGDEHADLVSPAADSIPTILASTVPFGERPTPTEPGPTDDETAEDEDRTTDPAPHTLDADAEVFFNTFRPGESAAANDHPPAVESLAPMEHDVPEARALSPHVHLRRAKLAKYVRAAVALSAALCLAAVVRGAVARVTHEHDATAHAMTSDIGRAVVAHQAPHDDAAQIVAAAVAKEPEAPPIASVQLDATPAKSAAEEKKSTRIALERGKLKDAIAAGERSIALDPTDGEAWLLLGAAYQDSGKSMDARRCFVECAKQGKRGPIHECRMMLR